MPSLNGPNIIGRLSKITRGLTNITENHLKIAEDAANKNEYQTLNM